MLVLFNLLTQVLYGRMQRVKTSTWSCNGSFILMDKAYVLFNVTEQSSLLGQVSRLF